MSIQNPLSSVYLGREGSGEAQIIRGGVGTAISGKALQLAERQKVRDELEKKQESKEWAAIEAVNPYSKWEADNNNYFAPEVIRLKNMYSELRRRQASEKDPSERYKITAQYKNEIENLAAQAKIDNETKDAYTKIINNYNQKQSEFDREININGISLDVNTAQNIFKDPFSYKEELVKMGIDPPKNKDVVTWRSENISKFVPQKAYDIDEDISKHALKEKPERIMRKTGTEYIVEDVFTPERRKSLYTSFKQGADPRFFREIDKLSNTLSETQLTDESGNKRGVILSSDNIVVQNAVDNVYKKNPNIGIDKAKELIKDEIGFQLYSNKLADKENVRPKPKYAFGGTTFNPGEGSDGVGSIQEKRKNTAVPGTTGLTQRVATLEGFDFTPTNVEIQAPEIVIDSETGEKINAKGVLKFSIGEIVLAPTVTKDYVSETRLPSGVVQKRIIPAGTIISDQDFEEVKKDLISKGLLKYEVVAYGRAIEDNGLIKREKDYIVPISNVEGSLSMLTEKRTAVAKSNIQNLKQKRNKKNAELGKPKSESEGKRVTWRPGMKIPKQ